MAVVANFLYSAGVNEQLHKDNAGNVVHGTVLIGPLQIIPLLNIPNTYSFSIYFQIRDFDIEQEHDLQVIFSDPEGNELAHATSKVNRSPSIPTVENLPKEYIGISSSMILQNIIFKSSGIYTTKINFDGKNIGSFDIFAGRKIN